MKTAARRHVTLCSVHRGARAGWRCAQCDRSLCPECVAPKKIRPLGSFSLSQGQSEVFICLPCGGMATPIMVKKVIEPYWRMLGRFVYAILTPEGIIQLAAISIALTLLTVLGLWGVLMAAFVYASYYFQVIRTAAHGGEKLPLPADFLDMFDVIRTNLRFALAASFVWLPGVIYIGKYIGFMRVIENPAELLNPGLFLVVALGVLYVPAAVIVAAIAESSLAMLNPMVTLRMIARIPGQYFLTAVVCVTLAVLAVVAGLLMDVIFGAMHVMFLSVIVKNLIGLMIPVLSAFILGRLIYQNAEHFGVVPREKLEEPEWPDAQAVGVLAGDARGSRVK